MSNAADQSWHVAYPSTIRPVVPDDLAALKAVIDANGLFPSDMLSNMIAGYLNGESADHFWITVDDGGPMAVAFYAPEPMTNGTWNVFLIAVHPDRQGEGRGAALLRHVEQALAARGERLLLVETSGLEEFERARAFYRKCGFAEEARIREFYQAGEDKVIFWKALGRAGQPGAADPAAQPSIASRIR